jgi:hypothetical protein
MGSFMNAMFWHDVQILKNSSIIQKLGLIPHIHYTFPMLKIVWVQSFTTK